MSNRLFQGVIHKMKDAMDRTIGVIDESGVIIACYLAGPIPVVKGYTPTFLADCTSLVYGVAEAKKYLAPILITAAASVICFAASVPVFDKKRI